MIGSDGQDDPGDQDAPAGHDPADRHDAEHAAPGEGGDDHGQHHGFPPRWVPSEATVRWAIIASAVIAAVGLALQR